MTLVSRGKPLVLLVVLALAAACSAPVDEEAQEDQTGPGPNLLEEGQDELNPRLQRGSTLPDHTLAWTIDDGPSPLGTGVNTQELARYLASEGVPTTFFFVASRLTNTRNMADWRAKRFPRVTPKIDSVLDELLTLPVIGTPLKHLVANHTFSHEAQITKLPESERVAEFINASNLLRPYFRDGIRFLRTPYASWNDSVYDTLQATNTAKSYVGNIYWNAGGTLNCSYTTSGWDCDQPEVAGTVPSAADWACWAPGKGRPAVSPSECAKGYLNYIEQRDRRGIVLMHDVNRKSVDMARVLIPQLKARGYSFVRLDQVPRLNAQLLTAGATPAAAVSP